MLVLVLFVPLAHSLLCDHFHVILVLYKIPSVEDIVDSLPFNIDVLHIACYVLGHFSPVRLEGRQAFYVWSLARSLRTGLNEPERDTQRCPVLVRTLRGLSHACGRRAAAVSNVVVLCSSSSSSSFSLSG